MSLAALPAMSTRRLLGAFLTEAKFEFLRLLRTPAFSIPIVILPIFFYVFFGVVIAGQRAAPSQFANAMFVGWTIYGVMGPGLFGFGILLATERDQGLLALKRALPMPPAAYLVAKMLMAAAFSAIIMLGLIAVGVTLGHVTLPAANLAAVAAVSALGVIPACAMGLFIGAWTPASAAPAVANMAYLAMAFLAGLFFPLPPSMQAWAHVWPTYHLMQLTLAAAGERSHGEALTHVAVLVATTVVFTALSARRLARSA